MPHTIFLFWKSCGLMNVLLLTQIQHHSTLLIMYQVMMIIISLAWAFSHNCIAICNSLNHVGYIVWRSSMQPVSTHSMNWHWQAEQNQKKKKKTTGYRKGKNKLRLGTVECKTYLLAMQICRARSSVMATSVQHVCTSVSRSHMVPTVILLA